MRVRNNVPMPATNRALGGDNANFEGPLAGSLAGLLAGSLEGPLAGSLEGLLAGWFAARHTFNH